MTTWANTSAPQQGQMLAFLSLLRPDIGTFAAILDTLSVLDSQWLGVVKAEVTALDAGTIIPDSTGLSGAVPLTREDVLSAMTAIEAILTTYNSQAMQIAYWKFAGFVNSTAR